jgi:dCMP deaminase
MGEPSPNFKRPERDEYFMQIAYAVRTRANCLGTRVGAVLVLDRRVISTGYNGTPEGMKNCLDGGCERCANRAKFGSGKGYDLCICVHAEQNAILAAARFGIEAAGSTLYTTTKPCFGCLKEMLQVKVQRVVYVHDWEHPDPNYRPFHQELMSRIPGGVLQLEIEDPWRDWAVAGRTSPPGDIGHSAK